MASENLCYDCGAPAIETWCDEGIGPYEFWGQKGVNHEWVKGSDCCGADLVEGGETTVQSKTVTARKSYRDSRGRTINPGDRYRRVVLHRWRKDGPSWWVVLRTLIERASDEAA